ncbi:hypothetical protein HYH02_013508 [Chlamydomonas schloesseri]|uniref:GATA-type domain-containing protein n=1 Tax=Chlamydomonas schloesseri TaxID=2026947 RepID=A0A835VWZ7_9CHLO|nr:hypothetical protein HYH02_013508 [Chlamydomonas schloesseri]|eukprot:KAG2430975.1 hypothetical protein HYH02_013508 [Chlamydomonas schloesseri]
MAQLQQPQAQPQPSLQVFLWLGDGHQRADGRIQYNSFRLNSTDYRVGDCVFLFPEDESYPPYVARILAAFVDTQVQEGSDPHCIEVKWFERRVNLEPATKGIEESEREVFELEDTDVNPIGCISGKCRIVKALSYEEARLRCASAAAGAGGSHGGSGTDGGAAVAGMGGGVGGLGPQTAEPRSEPWFFCRGYFQQSTNSFVAYTPDEMARLDVALDVGLGLVDTAAVAVPPGGQGQGLHGHGHGHGGGHLGPGPGLGVSEQPPTPTRLRGPTLGAGGYGAGGGPIWGLPQSHGHGPGGKGAGDALHPGGGAGGADHHPHHLGDSGEAGVGWGAAGLDADGGDGGGTGGEEELSDQEHRGGPGAGGGRNHNSHHGSGGGRARAAGQHHPAPAQQQPSSKKQKGAAAGRTCLECGATTTPQWREGPMGPKTLCNACGVRYVRSQQKAAGQKRGGHKNGQKPDAARGQGARTKRKPNHGGGSSGED